MTTKPETQAVPTKQIGDLLLVEVSVGTLTIYLWIMPEGSNAHGQPDFDLIGGNVWDALNTIPTVQRSLDELAAWRGA